MRNTGAKNERYALRGGEFRVKRALNGQADLPHFERLKASVAKTGCKEGSFEGRIFSGLRRYLVAYARGLGLRAVGRCF